jgi:hypothetical protein
VQNLQSAGFSNSGQPEMKWEWRLRPATKKVKNQADKGCRAPEKMHSSGRTAVYWTVRVTVPEAIVVPEVPVTVTV